MKKHDFTKIVVVKKPQSFYGGDTDLVVKVDRREVFIVLSNEDGKILRRIGTADCHSTTANSRSGNAQRPPQSATFLLCLFLSSTDRENMIGDLDEKFPKWVERHGVMMARFIYLIDVCATIYPAAQKLWWRAVKFVAKVGGLAGLTEFIRRIHW